MLTILYDRIRLLLSDRRERKGLLLLVESEMQYNSAMLESFDMSHGIVNAYTVSTLSSDVWNNSRTRLAQLLTLKHVAVLVVYYESIQFVRETVTYRSEEATVDVAYQRRFPVILDRIRVAKESGDTATDLGKRYLGARDWLDTDEQESASDQTD